MFHILVLQYLQQIDKHDNNLNQIQQIIISFMLSRKLIPLDLIIDLKNYKQSFKKWMQVRSHYKHQNQQQTHKLYLQYLYVIKPVIHHFCQLTETIDADEYGFYCEQLEQQQISILQKLFGPLLKFKICDFKSTDTTEDYSSLLTKESEKIFRINLSEKPKNEELAFWKNCVNVHHIEFQGVVIKGKGEGAKSLGMPTANLQLTQQLQEKLLDYPNGVYQTKVTFTDGSSFVGAGCIGTNPHYENFQNKRIFEVYILHDFGKQTFYGEKLEIRLEKLIRFEGKFKDFSSFLNAMHNDIQTIRWLSNQ